MNTAIQEISGNQVIYDLPSEKYHMAAKGISRSGLMEIAKNPRKYWWKYLSGLAETEETNSLRIGGGFHTFVLEPHKFNDVCVIVPKEAPRRPSIAQVNAKKPSEDTLAQIEWWKNFDAANGLKTYIKTDELAEMKEMAQSVLSEPASKKVISAAGHIESSFFWHDEDYGVDVKCRPDYYRDDGILLDLKTCADASEEAFQKSIVNYGYDLQAFMMMEGVERVTGKRPSDFVFVAVEKDAPYCVAFYSATPELLACGEARYHKLMAIYAACMKKNHWPGYGSFVRPINPPEWYVKKLTKEGPSNV